ncbi:hypothetical protein GCM10007874_66450 [Labrys miyagiensis]|uniref:Uncharacterized protein n=1 Tax=Labrys miyagiensis TaxID=346912 RepID=A0ABQ6CY64_9HYPH|nr:hypothetical protein GCM10007874_66450 [Labrys miyagiensis]
MRAQKNSFQDCATAAAQRGERRVLFAFPLTCHCKKRSNPHVSTAEDSRGELVFVFMKQRLILRPSPITFRCSHPRVGRDIAVSLFEKGALAIADPDGGRAAVRSMSVA